MKKSDRMKQLLVEQLKKTPIVQIACEKSGVSRATFYRWKTEDVPFRKAADEALAEGTAFVSDLAESQLLTNIKNGNLTATIFWLKNKHNDYKQHIFQSALSIAQDSDDNIYLEVFGQLKPETKRLIEPYLSTSPKDHDQGSE